MAQHARPARYASPWFEQFVGDVDPGRRVQLAHETAAALLRRVRDDADPEVVDRLLALAATDGIDSVIELWSDAEAHSLPGSLWRIHLLRTVVAQQPVETATQFEAGVARLDTADPIVAGAETPTGPAEITALADAILRGVFTGDFALALERAAAFARVLAAGSVASADDRDAAEPELATGLTRRAARLSSIASDLSAAAALWRRHELR